MGQKVYVSAQQGVVLQRMDLRWLAGNNVDRFRRRMQGYG